MPRSSYFQRIARTEKRVPGLRPPAAIFRRWTLMPGSTERSPTTARPDSAATVEPVRAPARAAREKSTVRNPSRVSAVEDSPAAVRKRVKPPQISSQEEVSKHSDIAPITPALEPPVTVETKSPTKSKRRTMREVVDRGHDLEVSSAKPSIQMQPKRERRILTNERKAAEHAEESTATSALRPVASPVRRRRARPEKQPLAILTVETVSERTTDRTPSRPLDSYRPNNQSAPTPRTPVTRWRRPEPSAPTVKIGTIDVHVAPPLPPQQARVVRPSGRSSATALSRGFTTPFGLRQG